MARHPHTRSKVLKAINKANGNGDGNGNNLDLVAGCVGALEAIVLADIVVPVASATSRAQPALAS